MKRVDVMSRSTTLVTMLSIVYALIDMKLIFLAPILTISIPYRFMKYKEENKYIENIKMLSNLFLFNLIIFIGTMFVTKKISSDIIEIISNILITFIYFKIISTLEKKKMEIYKNPKKMYDKINIRISSLETLYKKTEELMKDAKDEKSRNSMETKLTTIKYKIDELKRQASIIEQKIKSQDNKDNNK